jgi:hypothetical protein
MAGSVVMDGGITTYNGNPSLPTFRHDGACIMFNITEVAASQRDIEALTCLVVPASIHLFCRAQPS